MSSPRCVHARSSSGDGIQVKKLFGSIVVISVPGHINSHISYTCKFLLLLIVKDNKDV